MVVFLDTLIYFLYLGIFPAFIFVCLCFLSGILGHVFESTLLKYGFFEYLLCIFASICFFFDSIGTFIDDVTTYGKLRLCFNYYRHTDVYFFLILIAYVCC